MIPTEYKPLIDKLVRLTNDGSRNWTVTSDDSKFAMDIGLNGVHTYLFRFLGEKFVCHSRKGILLLDKGRDSGFLGGLQCRAGPVEERRAHPFPAARRVLLILTGEPEGERA